MRLAFVGIAVGLQIGGCTQKGVAQPEPDGATCSNPSYLKGVIECEPEEGPGCYVFSETWRLLGPTVKPPEVTNCSGSGFDVCGCRYCYMSDSTGRDASILDASDEEDGISPSASESGAANGAVTPAGDAGEVTCEPAHNCSAGRTCETEWIDHGGVDLGSYQNVCEELCLSDAECTAPMRCWAGHCAAQQCVRDSDCNRDGCGHCTA